MLLAWLRLCVRVVSSDKPRESGGQSCKTTAAAPVAAEALSCWFLPGCSCTERQRQAWAKHHGGYLADQLGSVREASGRVQVCWCLHAGWMYV